MTEFTAASAEPPKGAIDRAFIEHYHTRLLTAWNEHDTKDLPELVTDDVVWIDPVLEEPARGVDGVRQFMTDCFRWFPDLHFDITGSFCFADDAPVVMVPWRMTGTHLGRFDPPGYAPSRLRFDVQGIDVYTFRGQKISHYRTHYNQVEIARQLGWLPTQGSRSERLAAAVQRLRARLGAARR